jgi:hypothetical protein
MPHRHGGCLHYAPDRERPRRVHRNHLHTTSPEGRFFGARLTLDGTWRTQWRWSFPLPGRRSWMAGLRKYAGDSKAVARSYFNMSGNLAMLDATRLASSIVICFASMASASVNGHRRMPRQNRLRPSPRSHRKFVGVPWGRKAASHSITSSARASSVGGTSRPSARAVLRLITSSYLVGACTGRSAGFSPLRMRST